MAKRLRRDLEGSLAGGVRCWGGKWWLATQGAQEKGAAIEIAAPPGLV